MHGDASSYSSLNYATPLRRNTEGQRHLIFDGKDSFKKARAEFAENPDDYLSANQPNTFTFSPVFNSGLSIELDYFDSQYEYISAFEASSSASQRGERVRAAIGGGQITERNVYLSMRGLPKMPDIQIFFPEYWRKILEMEEDQAYSDCKGVIALVGGTEVLKHYRDVFGKDAATKAALAELLAIEAWQTYFKLENLIREWETNSWEVRESSEFPYPVLHDDDFSELWKQTKESVLQQRSRILAMAKGCEAKGDEPAGPIEAAKELKYRLIQRVGQGLDQVNNPEWTAAWIIDPQRKAGIDGVRINSLIRIYFEDPQLFSDLEEFHNIRLLSKAWQGLDKLPDIPVTSAELRKARLLAEAPGVAEVVRGVLNIWNKRTAQIVAAAEYSRQHAAEFAALSKTNQRILGLQFTEKTPDTKCFHKLLGMAGLDAKCIGRDADSSWLWNYRLEIASDIEPESASDFRSILRHQTRDELQMQIQGAIANHTTKITPNYLERVQQFMGIAELQDSEPRLTTEVLQSPRTGLAILSKLAQDWPDFVEIGAKFPKQMRNQLWDAIKKIDPQERDRILELKRAAA
ncbi:MAG: hypothetical protein F6K19_12870 [Cyanothece sp. SIO1E1]|nr:hypothetical protein [Cyanothece sp. SIO1E1]